MSTQSKVSLGHGFWENMLDPGVFCKLVRAATLVLIPNLWEECWLYYFPYSFLYNCCDDISGCDWHDIATNKKTLK
jgi:hypothetical protein